MPLNSGVVELSGMEFGGGEFPGNINCVEAYSGGKSTTFNEMQEERDVMRRQACSTAAVPSTSLPKRSRLHCSKTADSLSP